MRRPNGSVTAFSARGNVAGITPQYIAFFPVVSTAPVLFARRRINDAPFSGGSARFLPPWLSNASSGEGGLVARTIYCYVTASLRVGNFGKYANALLREVPVGYLLWMLQNLELSPWESTQVTAEVRIRGGGPERPYERRETPPPPPSGGGGLLVLPAGVSAEAVLQLVAAGRIRSPPTKTRTGRMRTSKGTSRKTRSGRRGSATCDSLRRFARVLPFAPHGFEEGGDLPPDRP